jgi:Bacterial PH domain
MDPNTQNLQPLPPESPLPQQVPQPQQNGAGGGQKNLHPMVVLQPGEQLVGEIKRHPFGIIRLYIGVVLATGLAAGLAFLVLPGMLQSSNDSSAMTQVYIGLGLLIAIMVLGLGVATTVYWQNMWVITTDSITQITQTGLFSRQVSQLSMDNLEDVTVDQDGIIPHMLNFGILKVESAGERSKFVFIFCPNPNAWARQILDIHEKFLEERRNVRQVGGAHANINTSN